MRRFCEAHQERLGVRGVVYKGYRILTIDGGRVMEHCAVWEKHNGPIPKGFHVHHINHDRLDNRIENLALIDSFEHSRLHLEDRNRAYKAMGGHSEETRRKISATLKARTYVVTPCYFEGCGKPSEGYSLCSKHYTQMKKHGYPPPGPKTHGHRRQVT